MDHIDGIEKLLAETARRCLRLIGTRSLTSDPYRQLSRWMFGCLNQRFTIRERVAKRGVGELSKVLMFVARACEVLLTIDETSQAATDEIEGENDAD